MSLQSEIEVKIRIAGIDLAWGEPRKPDGVCALEASSRGARVITSGLTHGDDGLLGFPLFSRQVRPHTRNLRRFFRLRPLRRRSPFRNLVSGLAYFPALRYSPPCL